MELNVHNALYLFIFDSTSRLSQGFFFPSVLTPLKLKR